MSKRKQTSDEAQMSLDLRDDESDEKVERCGHDKPLGACAACDLEGDLTTDAAREDAAF